MILKYDSIKVDKPDLKAVLFVFGDDEVWIPRSQIRDLDENRSEIDIPSWLAIDKGIEAYES